MALRIFFALLLACAQAWTSAAAQPPQRPRIFIVHSYDQEYVWCQYINSGILDALSGLPVTFEIFYLDAKRQPDPERIATRARQAIERMESFKPDVVIAADDAAQAHLVVPYLQQTDKQVIFCGLNGHPSLYGYPGVTISGVRERWHFREGFKLMKRLFPQAETCAFITEDTESGRFILADLREDLECGPFALKLLEATAVRTVGEFKRSVLALQHTADALAVGVYQSLLDEQTGQVAPPEEITLWLKVHAVKPTIGFADVAVPYGLLCGVLESGHEQGYLAGSMARKIVTGPFRAGELPMLKNDRGVVMVNLKTAERLGVSIPYEIIEAAGLVIK